MVTKFLYKQNNHVRMIGKERYMQEARYLLKKAKLKVEDYRLVDIPSYYYASKDDPNELTGLSFEFIVPASIAESVSYAKYTHGFKKVKFLDSKGKVLLRSGGLEKGNLKEITAFSLEDLPFYSHTIVGLYFKA